MGFNTAAAFFALSQMLNTTTIPCSPYSSVTTVPTTTAQPPSSSANHPSPSSTTTSTPSTTTSQPSTTTSTPNTITSKPSTTTSTPSTTTSTASGASTTTPKPSTTSTLTPLTTRSTAAPVLTPKPTEIWFINKCNRPLFLNGDGNLYNLTRDLPNSRQISTNSNAPTTVRMPLYPSSGNFFAWYNNTDFGTPNPELGANKMDYTNHYGKNVLNFGWTGEIYFYNNIYINYGFNVDVKVEPLPVNPSESILIPGFPAYYAHCVAATFKRPETCVGGVATYDGSELVSCANYDPEEIYRNYPYYDNLRNVPGADSFGIYGVGNWNQCSVSNTYYKVTFC